MELHYLHIVLVDISGYTRFISGHRKSLLHAEGIITRLMERVVECATHPLTINKLEGDAALFYAIAPATAEAAQDVLRQVHAFFAAFYGSLEKMSECDCCRCEACGGLRQLDLKAVVHFGEAAIKQVHQFTELAGPEVIVAHRLLKNSVPQHQYILLTDAFYQLLGPQAGQAPELRSEHAEGIGRVSVHVQCPGISVVPQPERFSAWVGIRQRLWLDWYALTRRLGRRAAPFKHLGTS